MARGPMMKPLDVGIVRSHSVSSVRSRLPAPHLISSSPRIMVFKPAVEIFSERESAVQVL